MSVRQYYDESIQPYLVWSKKLNIHFGYFRWGVNPFRLENMLEEMNREVLRRLDIPPTSSPVLLDIGCGCGATMIDFAGALPAAKLHGVTLSENQISVGKKMVHEKGLNDRIQFHDADFEELPFEKNFADGAILLESACYGNGPDKAALLEELSRVISPNGKIIIVDGFRRHSRPLPDFLENIYRKNMRHWHLTELADIQLFTEKLKAAGFENIKVEDISWRTLPSALHIPFIAFRLYFKNTTPKKRKYGRALLHTLYMGIFRKHFGYFMVTAEKK